MFDPFISILLVFD